RVGVQPRRRAGRGGPLDREDGGRPLLDERAHGSENRGVREILFVCTDGLSGFPEAIEAVFPQAVNQTCIVHLVRQSLRYLSYRERKSCAAELRRIYTAADADAARAVLDELIVAWADS